MYMRRPVYHFYLVVFAKFSKCRPANAVVLSVLIDFGTPFKFIFCSRNLTAVWPSVVLRKLAAGHSLNRSIESKIKNLWFLSVIGPMNSNWMFSFDLLSLSSWFISVLGMLGLMVLPDILQGTQFSHFFCMASVIRGHQKCLAAIDILFKVG